MIDIRELDVSRSKDGGKGIVMETRENYLYSTHLFRQYAILNSTIGTHTLCVLLGEL